MMQPPTAAAFIPQQPRPLDPSSQQPPPQYGQPPLQYGQPPQQPPWMMMPPPPHYQQPPPPQMWNPQQPPPQAPLPAPIQSQPYSAPNTNAAPVTSSDEIRSLWIGDLQYWMDENYLFGCFAAIGEVVSVKVIRNKVTQYSEGYGFIEFANRAAAERALSTYNGTLMPQSEQAFRLNWASLSAGQRRHDNNTPEYSIFVGDLAADVTDSVLQEAFHAHYPSVKGAKVITDHASGRPKGYGFVKFGDEGEQQRALSEMNGAFLSTRPMRIGPVSNKKAETPVQKDYQNTQANPGESDPNNTTIFVGGLDSSVQDDQLRQVFSPYGELVHVKIPVGKACGFVQFTSRTAAEQALSALNGALIGSQNVRLSWGRTPSAKQAQPTSQAQWNGAYYGYPQGYDAYSYAAAAPQDPNMYYANYAASGYRNYQPPQQ